MKKIIALVIVCGFAIAMVACTKKKVEETTDSISTKADSLADSTANNVADSTKEVVK